MKYGFYYFFPDRAVCHGQEKGQKRRAKWAGHFPAPFHVAEWILGFYRLLHMIIAQHIEFSHSSTLCPTLFFSINTHFTVCKSVWCILTMT